MEKTNIYGLFDKSDNIIMYVGKTDKPLNKRLSEHIYESKESRKSNRDKDLWIRSLNKKPGIILLEICDREIWQKREIFWIDYYKKINQNLKNLAKGGCGPSGYKQSEQVINNSILLHSKAVLQLDFNYNIIKEYKSRVDIKKELKIENLSRCIKSKGTEHHGDFLWMDKKDYEIYKDSFKNITYKKPMKNNRKLYQYNKDLDLIKIWNSQLDASKELKISVVAISNAVCGKLKSYKGFIWSKTPLEKPKYNNNLVIKEEDIVYEAIKENFKNIENKKNYISFQNKINNKIFLSSLFNYCKLKGFKTITFLFKEGDLKINSNYLTIGTELRNIRKNNKKLITDFDILNRTNLGNFETNKKSVHYLTFLDYCKKLNINEFNINL